MTWDNNYRRLRFGETIKAGDEVDACRDGWRDPPKWVPVSEKSIGTAAPDPNYPSHRVYRRKFEECRVPGDYTTTGTEI